MVLLLLARHSEIADLSAGQRIPLLIGGHIRLNVTIM